MIQGVDVYLDLVAGIAHNKVMIIDQSIVITGSFNFTESAEAAEKRNTENVVIMFSEDLAKQ